MILGHRVGIGPILPVDLPSLFRWSDDEEAARSNATYKPPNWEHEAAFWTNTARDPSRVFFAIRGVADPAILGFVQIVGIDPVHRSACIGLRIGAPEDRRRGYGREALELAIRYCWDWLNLSRLSLNVLADNDGAIALYRSLGFEHEGVQRRALFIHGRWVDLLQIALLHPGREG